MRENDWRKKERELIAERRSVAFEDQTVTDTKANLSTCKPDTVESTGSQNPDPKNLVGLSLSGGGIRSALYNDGFLQGLSHRGFLRFVDYLASVSGGGYIAGHLISQARDSEKKPDSRSNSGSDSPSSGFHDDDTSSCNQQTQRWHLGRDPKTGKVDEKRLAGVGGYLSRPLEILPAFIWSCFFSTTFYIGVCGILATLIALIWRSFDDPTFRTVYLNVLHIQMGDELLIAFIPSIFLIALTVVLEVGFSLLSLCFSEKKRMFRKVHTSFRAVFLVLCAMSLIASVAIFLGNGTTRFSANSSSSIYLNNYAQWLAVIAGTLQVLVFFGSDKLFKSERQEAKQWQKVLQRGLSVSVILFLCFAMIHWMGRENISGFVEARDPYLVVGDVEDWTSLKQLFISYEKDRPSKERGKPTDSSLKLELEEKLNLAAVPESKWLRTLLARRFGWIVEVDRIADLDRLPKVKTGPDAVKDEDQNTAYLGERLLAAAGAYYLNTFVSPNSLKQAPDAKVNKVGSGNADNKLIVKPSVANILEQLRDLREVRQSALDNWNNYLNEPGFTEWLVKSINEQKPVRTSIPASYESRNFHITSSLADLLDSDLHQLTADEKKLIASIVRRQLGNLNAEQSEFPSVDKPDYAAVNRQLLEKAFPNVVRDKSIASTYVVPPYDQRARRSWLGFWLIAAAIGATGGVFRHSIATVFRFYRRQIGANFLVASHDRQRCMAETPICNLKPTADGLPYPLILAASMDPVTINGGYDIEAKTFMFTPLYSGHLDDPNNTIDSKQVAISGDAITLADAVTLSGAAVTPLMTTNRCLSLLVDFFNSGLGMRVYRSESTELKSRSLNARVFLAVLSSILFMLVIYYAADGNWGSTGLGFFTSLVITWCLVFEVGVPHFLKTLLIPREVGPDATDEKKNAPRKSFYVADGGFTDYLGVTALLERRCSLIVISDAGANVGDDHLGTLARMCETASAQMGIQFLDLDHEAPIDFGRLKFDEKRLVHQPYLCMRVRYPEGKEGVVVYCQMAISESDPIEIQQIRHRFPTFPDEPTTNQFYSEDQVAAYRNLGYHIASRMCRELERWTSFGLRQPTTSAAENPASSAGSTGKNAEPASTSGSPTNASPTDRAGSDKEKSLLRFRKALLEPQITYDRDEVPVFDVLVDRLLTAYRLACYEEISYKKDDVFSEALWLVKCYAFPNFTKRLTAVASVSKQMQSGEIVEAWLRQFESSADVRSAYRKAILEDVNVIDAEFSSYCAELFLAMVSICSPFATKKSDATAKDANPQLAMLLADERLFNGILAAHLASLAIAGQEIHRGRPHSAFQIGGRRKIVDICLNIANSIQQSLASPSNEPDLLIKKGLSGIIAEILELERSVFQGGEHVTTVSFAQCLSSMWGRMAHVRATEQESCVVASGEMINRARTHFSKVKSTSIESKIVRSRHLLDSGIQKVNVEVVANALFQFWYLGYFGMKQSAMLEPRDAFVGFGFARFPQLVSKLCQTKNSVAMQRAWETAYDTVNDLRIAYQAALQHDAAEIALGEDSAVFQLWRDLNSTASGVDPNVSRSSLLGANCTALAIAIADLNGCPSLKLRGINHRALTDFCTFLDRKISGDDSNLCAFDASLEFYRLAREVGAIWPIGTTPDGNETLGRFAVAALSIWTGQIRGSFTLRELVSQDKARDSFIDPELDGLLKTPKQLFEKLGREIKAVQSEEGSPKSTLEKLWYRLLVTDAELKNIETTASESSPPGNSSKAKPQKAIESNSTRGKNKTL